MNTSHFYFPLISCDKEPYSRCKVNGKWWTPDCEQVRYLGVLILMYCIIGT
ncbi:MAG: hypothetical protein LC107_05170 [Chitinophagales bacterium]|nr:hypothetical protein [Chitinophagales bacterium]